MLINSAAQTKGVLTIGVGSKELLEWAPKSYWSGLQRVKGEVPDGSLKKPISGVPVLADASS